MPSRNSVNKPKDKILHRSKASSLGQRRAAVRAKGYTRATAHITASPASLAHSLYRNTKDVKTPVTTQTLSAKRLAKIERNKKYAAAREVQSKKSKTEDEEMQLDEDEAKNVNSVTLARTSLWNLIEMVANGEEKFIAQPSGNGTTLGEAVF